MGNPDKVVCRGWHDTFGWLRRREHDEPYGFCYETPDGEQMYSRDPQHRDKAMLARYRDLATGKHYTSFYYNIGEKNGRYA